jgi:REP element-mobilizing transposase RayT
MARGIEGRDIFLDDADRARFMALLEHGLVGGDYRLYAWALMRNHYHLLVRTSDHPLGALMRRLNGTYATHFSKRHDRRGYLFQDRYKSLVTQDQHYVEELVRYIHVNPLRAGVCSSIDELDVYPWTGHAVLMGRQSCTFQDTWTILRRFGQSTESARKKYREFVSGSSSGDKEDMDEIGDTVRRADTGRPRSDEPDRWVIGDPEFVKGVVAKDRQNRLRLSRHRVEKVTLEDIAEKVCVACGVSVEQLRRRTRATHAASVRKLFAYLCRTEYGFAVVDIGRFLGTSGPPMSVRIGEGAELVKSKPFDTIFRNLRPY